MAARCVFCPVCWEWADESYQSRVWLIGARVCRRCHRREIDGWVLADALSTPFQIVDHTGVSPEYDLLGWLAARGCTRERFAECLFVWDRLPGNRPDFPRLVKEFQQ